MNDTTRSMTTFNPAAARLVAFLVCALFLAPVAAAATELPNVFRGGEPAAASASTLSTGPYAPLPMRVPDSWQLDSADDRQVGEPANSRTPLAAGVANWTVLVYMVADNDLEPFAIQDINEMEAAASSASVQVAVELDRSPRYDTSNGDWSSTRRYRILHDTNASSISSLPLVDLGELNMGDPQALADFLVWGVDSFPASHFLVVLWDHGYGWSGGFGNDLTDGDHLSLAEIREALTAGARHLGRPFDVIGFDACLMQQVEVLFELSGAADYFVGAEDLEPAAGWVYDEMLAPVVSAPSISPDTLSRQLVNSYMDYYGFQGDAMMSAADSRTVRTSLADAMNMLALELGAVVEDPRTMSATSPEKAMWEARDKSPAMFNSDYIDLGEFARRLGEDVRLPDSARAAARAVREALNASVLEEAHSVYKPGLAGLSAYLPATAVPARYVTTRFAIDTLWDEFLVAMLSGVPTSGALPSLLLSEPADGDPVARLFEATATASSAAPGVVRLQYKSAWDNWSTVSSGTSPLPASVLLDAGIASGPTVVSFRALDAQGRPSAVAERQVTVVDLPVTLSPVLTEFPLAINRTRAIVIDATPRDPFFSFTVAWQGLPSQVNGAGSTTDVNFGSAPAPAFPITLQLAASPAASEGRYPIRLVVAAGSAPSVKTVLGFDLVLSLSLPDIAVAPLSLSDDLPLPGDPVFVWTNVTNLGFENVSDTRIQVTVTNASGTAELANYTVGPLTPGAGVPVTANFTAALGLQEVRVRALPEPAVVELNSSNNEHSRAVMLDRFSVALEPPALPVRGALGGNSTPVAVRMVNTGTDADNYTLAVSGLSNGSWTAVLATNAVYLAGRASQTLMIDVTPPAGAEGGDTLTFDLTANSLADTSVSASAALRVSIEETFSATVSALPNDIEVPYVGSTQVGLLLTNTGNGHESFLLLLQSGDPKLSARLDNFTAVLAPGASSAFVLLVADEGLFSTDRPYAVEVIALSQGSGARFSALVSVRVEPHAALTVEPLDPSPSVGAGLNATFHVLVRNAGNTNAVTSITAASTMPELAARVGASGALLSPGGFLIVNVTAQFASAPLAGTFPVTVLATDTRTGASGNATVEVVVPALRDYSAGVTAASGEGSRVLERTITIENRGNVPEAFSVVVGYVAVGLQVALTPSNGTILVPARGNATLVVRVEWPAPSQAAGQIPIVFTPRGGGSPLTVTVPYAFEQPPTDSALGWAAVALASIAGIGAYFLATRKRGPDPPPS